MMTSSRGRARRARRDRGLRLLAPSALAVAAVALGPTIFVAYLSLFEWYIFKPQRGRPFVGLQNYLELLASPTFQNSLIVTVVFLLLAVALSLVVGLALALLLNEEIPARGLLRTAFVLPLALPPVVAGFTWRFLLDEHAGVIGAWLLPRLGIDLPTILGHPEWALVAVAVADAWFGVPLAFLVLLAGLQAIPAAVIESARVDGAGGWPLLWWVILPQIHSAVIMTVLMRVMLALSNFAVIYTMTQGGPGEATQTLVLLGYKLGFTLFNMGHASALGVLIGVMTIALALWLLVRGERAGSAA